MIECPRPNCKHRDLIRVYRTERVERASGWRALFGFLRAQSSGKVYTCARCLAQFGVNPEGTYAVLTPTVAREMVQQQREDVVANGAGSRLRTPDISWSSRGEE